MRGITIIIILSVVWSIVSAIIQKRAAAAQKLQLQQGGAGLKVDPTQVRPQVFRADPRAVKIEALRRKQMLAQSQGRSQRGMKTRSAQPTTATAGTIRTPREALLKRESSSKILPIEDLHDAACPVPPTRYARSRVHDPAKQLAAMLQNRRNIRTAIVLNELLSKPLALRPQINYPAGN